MRALHSRNRKSEEIIYDKFKKSILKRMLGNTQLWILKIHIYERNTISWIKHEHSFRALCYVDKKSAAAVSREWNERWNL
jgi:hypothetical protein